ncbi:MAG: hypothetical protein RL481_342 [Pseudomonadota bacterium]|jgi:uncharacterized protein YqgC (DUF456 family)
MNDPASGPEPRDPSSAQAGGIFLFVGLLIGAIVGTFMGQPSLGILIGFAAGALIAVAVWLRDRRRG